METTEQLERVYRDCKAIGLKAVAVQLGIDCQQLVDRLHHAGVAGARGCPSRKEIAERCLDVRRSWNDEHPDRGREAAVSRVAG